MELNRHTASKSFLIQEFAWLEKLISDRTSSYFTKDQLKYSIYDVAPPTISNESLYEQFLLNYKFEFEERVIVSMILASVLKPQIFNIFLTKNKITGVRYTEFGGKIIEDRFIPTYRTAAFVLSGNELPLILIDLFQNEPPIFKSLYFRFE